MDIVFLPIFAKGLFRAGRRPLNRKLRTMEIILSDLGIGLPIVKGQNMAVRNCWHFSTDGTYAEVLFRDRTDFVDAMNRIYLLARKYRIVVLAFCLMDNHIHLILYGVFEECNRFVHELVRQISSSIARRHGLRHELLTLPVHYQTIDDDFYLKKAVCYVHKNPTAANLAFLPHDYPWSSGSLFFRSRGEWTFPDRRPETIGSLNGEQRRERFRTREPLPDDLLICGDLILPVNYVPVRIVESLYRSAKAYLYFMNSTREEDVEARGGAISRLSLPDAEMRQHKRVLLKELFGVESSNTLNTQQRIRLGKELRRRFNSSPKQIARLCGLSQDDLGPYLK